MIASDATCLATRAHRRRRVRVLPLIIGVKTGSCRRRVSLTTRSFCSLVGSTRSFPGDSRPTINTVCRLCRRLTGRRSTVVDVRLSDNVDNACRGTTTLDERCPRFGVRPFSSRVDYCIRTEFILRTTELTTINVKPRRVVTHLRRVGGHSHTCFVISSLVGLRHNNELSNKTTIVNSVVGVGPILRFSSGGVIIFRGVEAGTQTLQEVRRLLNRTTSGTSCPVVTAIVRKGVPRGKRT